ncbi:hypothetical protein AwErysi_04080 [Erysipelotrichaceae bacterium]|nr:hypothetical protein AwErysi_04080 [Erysipelotrichaceae bacterium]
MYYLQDHSYVLKLLNGLLIRTVFKQIPPRVEYTLTATGYSLEPILDVMYVWGY